MRYPMFFPTTSAQRLMMVEEQRVRAVDGICFVLGVDRPTAEQLLDVHLLDYDEFLAGGEEFERAKRLIAG